ncbi:hypothetical protein OESDEN_07630 [Oesophagostomum dentatum]|uniref:Uncharacterized protein n=1 Tax=Oesophagostomum dentatum TaxID=61180 RepID=A0A0B1T9K1_OESDE|nr:hypothetical protein OESDEN_07630 [Oesophagostomum dentatum]
MLIVFLLVFTRSVTSVSLVRDYSTTEKAPFSAEAGIFSNEELGQAFPRAPDSDSREARIGLRSRKTSVKPPGFEPQPPGTESEENPELIRRINESTASPRDYSTAAPISYGDFRPAENTPPTVAYGDFRPAESDREPSGKELHIEVEESSGEQKPTTSSSHLDVEFSPDSEGSGHEELNRSVEKVSGEVGRYPFDERRLSLVDIANREQQERNNETEAAPEYGTTSGELGVPYENLVASQSLESPEAYDSTGSSPESYDSTMNTEPTSKLPDSGYEQTIYAEVTTRTSEPGYNSEMYETSGYTSQNTAPPESLLEGIPRNAILAESDGFDFSSQTDGEYEGTGQSTSPFGSTYEATERTTAQPEVSSAQPPVESNEDVVAQTPSTEERPEQKSSYNMPSDPSFATAAQTQSPVVSLTSENTPTDEKQLQDFSAAITNRADHMILKPANTKKIPSGDEFLRSSKFKKGVNANVVLDKAALFGPPADRAPPRRGAVEGCPEPILCAKNCFVFINENGCQDCQCMWQALACDIDDDCPEPVQYCDLGKCNCRPGMRQDMSRSGFCQPDPEFKRFPPPGVGEFAKRSRRAAKTKNEDLRNGNQVELPAENPETMSSRVL